MRTAARNAIAHAVFGNIGSIITVQVGAHNAEILSEQLTKHPGQTTRHDLTNLPKFTADIR